MRNLLAFLAAAIVAFAGLGWYLGWYTIHTAPAGDGHREVKIDLNTGKIGQDLEKGGKAIGKALEKSTKDKAESPADAPHSPDAPTKETKKPGASS